VRLLLVSDLHYALPQYDWVAGVAADFDAVVVAGDHLDVGGHAALEAQSAAVIALLGRLAGQTTVLACSGNHDLTGRHPSGEKAAPWLQRARVLGAVVDDDTIDIADTRFTVCPWWDGTATREAVDARLAADAEDRPERWICVYHSPPGDSPTSWTGSRHIGDDDLVAWIERFGPDHVLAGHIHESPFKPGGSWVDRVGSTVVLNAGRQVGPIPAHVMLDTDSGEARRWSSAGVEVVDVGAADLTPRPVLAPAQ
jgi:Icc-related predicted phosphoesterase